MSRPKQSAPNAERANTNQAAIETETVGFDELGVCDSVNNALIASGFHSAFPIQVETIKAALAGSDICAKAPTGSGKTLAFGVPAVQMAEKAEPHRPTALILAPTRELATQIKEELLPIAKARSRRILTVFGGTNIERDIRRFEEGIDVLVACPGRLEDLISRRAVELGDAAIVVIDEADRMADMGFLPSVKRLLDLTPAGRQTLLFSATLDGDVQVLIDRYQNDPLRVQVADQAEEVGEVTHSWHLIEPADRIDSAVDVLKRFYSAIVFCRTRRGCARVSQMLNKRGVNAVAIHGDLSQSQRERALRSFTSGDAQVLVATDVAARGIHVDNVELVMHYDPAANDKDYIHRSGRTGRAGADGRVISMVVKDKSKLAKGLQRDLGMKRGFSDLDLDALGAVKPASKKRKSYRDNDSQTSGGSKKGSDKRGSGRRGSARNDSSERSGKSGRNSDRRYRDRSERNERGYRGNRDNRGYRGGRDNYRDRDNRDERNERGNRDNRNDRGYRDNREERGGRDNYRDRNDRNERDGRNRYRDRNDRGYRGNRDDRGYRGNRDDRNDRGNRWHGEGENRRDRDKNDRSNRRGAAGKPRNYRQRDQDDRYSNRDDRYDWRKPRRTRKSKSNDWFPEPKKKRFRDSSSSGYRPFPKEDDERSERGSRNGSNTQQRKNRKAKGRHKDQQAQRNKGKRANPSAKQKPKKPKQ